MLKKNLITCLKIAVSLSVLLLLFHEVQFSTIVPYLKTIEPSYYLLAILTIFITSLIASARWHLITKQLKFNKPLSFFIKSYLQGIMFNQVLPTSIGGDAYRVLEVSQNGCSKREAFNSVLTDRLYGFAGLILINFLVLGQAFHLYSLHIFMAVVLTLIGCSGIILFLCMFHFANHPFFQTRLRWIYDLSLSLRASYGNGKGFTLRAILGVIPNFLSICAIALIARSLHMHAHLIDFMIIIPSVTLLTMIPISMAGWGLREGAMVFLGAAIGLPKPALLATSLLYGLLLIINSIPGLILFIKKHHFTAQVEA